MKNKNDLSKNWRGFSPFWNEMKRVANRLMAEILQPYRTMGSHQHRLIIRAYQSLLAESEYVNKAQLEKLQLIRLKKILRIAETIPWWNEYFARFGIKSGSVSKLSDIERLPPITKRTLKDIPLESLASRMLPEQRLLRQQTSGTTGVPFRWGADKNTWFVETPSYFHRAISWHASVLEAHSLARTAASVWE